MVLSTLTPLAPISPDGLEKVAADEGFISNAVKPILEIAPDYMVHGVASRTVSIVLSALAGSILLFGMGYGLAKLLRTKSET